jgi:hypothetical protein
LKNISIEKPFPHVLITITNKKQKTNKKDLETLYIKVLSSYSLGEPIL